MNLYDSFNQIDAQTAEEMARQAGLNFTVSKKPNHYYDSNGNAVVTPDKVSIVRDDNDEYLGTVGVEKGVVQFEKVLGFTEILVTKGEAAYVSGMALGGCRKAVVVMKTPDKILLGPNDEVECYFYISTSHDSSESLNVTPAPLRTFNGTILTLPEGFGKFRFRHTKHVANRLDKERMSITKVKDYWEHAQKSFNLMSMVQLTPSRLDEYWKLILPNDSVRSENIRDRMDTIFKTHPAYQFPATKNTLLGAYLAVIEFVDNEMGVRVTGKKNTNEEDAKMNSLIDGMAAKRKSEAFAGALRLQAMFGSGPTI